MLTAQIEMYTITVNNGYEQVNEQLKFLFSCLQDCTSLQNWIRMSLNFLIRWLLMASVERMCLNFRSRSKAAVEERSVLKDWSMMLMASSSIDWADIVGSGPQVKKINNSNATVPADKRVKDKTILLILHFSTKANAFSTHLNRIVKIVHNHFPASHFTLVKRIESNFLNRHVQFVHSAQRLFNLFRVPCDCLEVWTKDILKLFQNLHNRSQRRSSVRYLLIRSAVGLLT